MKRHIQNIAVVSIIFIAVAFVFYPVITLSCSFITWQSCWNAAEWSEYGRFLFLLLVTFATFTLCLLIVRFGRHG